MTPTEIEDDHHRQQFHSCGGRSVRSDLLAKLFDIAPGVRTMFPDDMADQRRKLVNELGFLINAIAAFGDPEEFDAMVARTQALGRRHVGYGATAEMFEPVGAALVSALYEHVDSFGEENQNAWVKLFGFVATTMLEGAAQAASAGEAA